MQALTTEDLIKMLPFKEEFREELLDKYASFTDDQKYSIERIVWDYYDEIYEERLQKNMDLAMERAKHNEEKMDHDFYKRVNQQTEQELQEEFSKSETTVDLSEAREELEEIIKKPAPSQ